MSDTLDQLVEDLQARILEEAKEVYSPLVLKYWENPSNFGKLEHYNAHAKIKGQCGDTVEWFLLVEEEKIKEVSFLTDGCAGSIACNALLTEMVKGKTLEEALNIAPEDILNTLGKLPEQDKHCAYLAIETLHEAIKNYWRG